MFNAEIKPRPLMSEKTGAMQGAVRVPGDKSISHRALILGAMAEGRTDIDGLLESGDILCTAKALQAMGVSISKNGTQWSVIGSGLGGFLQPTGDLDFGNSGTGARLMMGVVAGHAMRARFTGDDSLQKRPMGRVLDPLRKMGLNIAEAGQNTLPLTLIGHHTLVPITYETPVPSAQVKSAILLAALLTPGTTTVIEREKTRDHTEIMLAAFGAANSSTTRADGRTQIEVRGQKSLRGVPVQVPGDPSSAAFLTAAALLCDGSDVLIENVLINPTRTGFYSTLLEMGADIGFQNERRVNGEPVADLRVRYSRLRGVHVPAVRAPSMIDEYPILAAVAAFADGETVMEGLSELRVKESDRLAAMVDGLTICGVDARADGDTLRVRGKSHIAGGVTVRTHFDHRIAMAFLVLGLASDQPITVDDASMIATSFPEFRDLIGRLGGRLRDV